MTVRISDVWDEAWQFARREAALWLPIALACWGLPALVPAGHAPTQAELAAGKADPVFFVVLLVMGLAMLFGALALSALVLRPGGTVADALRTGLRRYPGALGTAMLLTLCLMAYILVLLLLFTALGLGASPAGLTGGGAPPTHALAGLILAVPLLVAGVRLVPLWAAIVAGARGGWGAIVASVQATGGIGWRLALVWGGYALALQLAALALTVGLGSLVRLLTLATGAGAAGDTLVSLVVAVLSALGNGFWAIFAAHLYRRLRPEPLSGIFE